MARQYYECTDCGANIFIDVPVTEKAPSTIDGECRTCHTVTVFDRVIGAPHMTAGLYSQKYGGKVATKGWGTYNVDYGKKGSDLVIGRARELCMQTGGGYDPLAKK